jgi:ribonuclease P protein component
MVKRFGLPETERLKSRKQIDALFAQGKGFAVYPIRVTYRFAAVEPKKGLQIGVTASKRLFKKALTATVLSASCGKLTGYRKKS